MATTKKPKTPKNDSVKNPWIARDGDITPGRVSAKLKAANEAFNAQAGLTKKTAKNPTSKKK